MGPMVYKVQQLRKSQKTIEMFELGYSYTQEDALTVS